MRGLRRLGRDARLRATALLLTGALVATAATVAAHPATSHKHGPRPAAAIAVTNAAPASHPLRDDLAAAATAGVRLPEPIRGWADRSELWQSAGSGTPPTAPVRGPPGVAAA